MTVAQTVRNSFRLTRMSAMVAASAEEWEQVCSDTFQLCAIDWVSAGFHGAVEPATLAEGAAVIRVDSAPMGVVRSARHAARMPCGDWMLVIHRGTEIATVEQFGRSGEIKPGDAVLVDTASAYRFSFSGRLSQLVLKVPHELVEQRADEVRGLCAQVVPSTSPALRVLASFTTELADVAAELHQTAMGAELVHTAGDLIGTMIRAAKGMPPPAAAGRTAMFRLMQNFVLAHLVDPTLSPASMAAAHGVSVRYVNSLFQAGGTSPAAYIRGQRLDRARHVLADPRRRRTPIAMIAGGVGFADITTFIRAFRRQFGVTPGEYRDLVGAGTTPRTIA
jgi:AraC-like DNA-binding protein